MGLPVRGRQRLPQAAGRLLLKRRRREALCQSVDVDGGWFLPGVLLLPVAQLRRRALYGRGQCRWGLPVRGRQRLPQAAGRLLLFPRIAHSHYPRISEKVRPFVTSKGGQYIHFDTVWDNLSSVHKYLKRFSDPLFNPVVKGPARPTPEEMGG